MATVPVAPLFVNKREVAPVHNLSQFVLPSLLVTVLAVPSVIPLPISAAHSFPLQVIRKPNEWLNPDTSRGTARTLIAKEVRIPNGTVAPHFVRPHHEKNEWINPDTSKGTAKTLIKELTRPDGTVAPFFVQLQHGRNEWLNPDTTQDVPKVLLPEVTGPSGINAPFFQQVQRTLQQWLNPNTSIGTAKSLYSDQIPPRKVPPHFVIAEKAVANWLPADTTKGSAKTLIREVKLPFFVLNQPSPSPVLNVTDTARGTPNFLFTLPLPPGFALQLAAPVYQFQVVNTSQASNAIYYPPTPIVSPAAGNAILWIVGPKGIKTKIRFISGTEPEKES